MALTDYVIMPSADYVAACDKVRERTGKADPIKSGDFATEIEGIPAGGGAELNIAYGDTPPEDTSKLWVKTKTPESVRISPNFDSGTTGGTDASGGGFSITSAYRHCQNCCATVGSYMYSFGGYRLYNTTRSVLSNYILKISSSVTKLTATLPTAQADAICAAVDDKIYIFRNNGTDIYCFDTSDDSITTISATLPNNDIGRMCAAVGTKIYILGGLKSSQTARMDIYCFDTENQDEGVYEISTKLHTACWFGGCAAVGTKIYILGGFNSSVGTLDCIQCFDTENGTTVLLSGKLHDGKYGMGCAAVGNHIVLYGGISGMNGTSFVPNQTLDIYDIEEDYARRTSINATWAMWSCGALHPTKTGAVLFVGGCRSASNVSSNTPTQIIESAIGITPCNGIALPDEELFIKCAASTSNWTPAVTDGFDLKVCVDQAYMGNENGVGKLVSAFYYDESENNWKPI